MDIGGFNWDASGFLSHICSSCERRFKTRVSESGKLPAHCPYCEHSGEDWWTPEQRRYLEIVSKRMVLTQLNEQMRNSKSWKPDPMPPEPSPPAESDDDLPNIAVPACCAVPIRHDGKSTELRCTACGTKPMSDKDRLTTLESRVQAQEEFQTGLFNAVLVHEFRHWQWVGAHDPNAKTMGQTKIDRAAAAAAFDSVVAGFPEAWQRLLASRRDHYVEHLVENSERATPPDEN